MTKVQLPGLVELVEYNAGESDLAPMFFISGSSFPFVVYDSLISSAFPVATSMVPSIRLFGHDNRDSNGVRVTLSKILDAMNVRVAVRDVEEAFSIPQSSSEETIRGTMRIVYLSKQAGKNELGAKLALFAPDLHHAVTRRDGVRFFNTLCRILSECR